MFYTVGEMAKRLGVRPSTLRFYDKEGLLPFVTRSSGGIRMFEDKDIEWLSVISCLKKSGMRLENIKKFIEMAMEGDKTVRRRLEMISAQKREVEAQIAALEKTMETLEFKEWYYTKAKRDGTTERVKNMPDEQLPEKFRRVRAELRGK